MVRSIYEDKMGHLWVGTKLQGLNLFDRTNKRFIRYTMFDGLPSNSIYCILEDANGNLWLGTHNGISKFNPVAKIFQNFNKDYGLQDNVFTSEAQCRSKSGELIFGGNNGFNIFYPEKIKKEIYYAPLVITSIKIFDQTICRDLSKPVKLTLTYSQNYISFGFALLDYFNPLQNEYQYKMEGVDNNWVLSGNRHYASYSSLKPGRYIFYAKASNAYGTWNNNDISVEITILPPWWQTWWFKLMFFLILIVSISFAYYLRIKRYREKQKELTVLVRQRTKEISHANDILLERQARIEEYAKELLTRTENLREANDVLLDNQKLIEKQAEQLQDSNQQLKYTNEQLAILNSTKDRFFSIIAHDLRNPFNTVSGFAEVLQREYKMLPPEKIERFLKLIYISSTNGNSLLENLLQWSRAQTGSITFEPSKLNLSAIADATINMMSGDAVHKNIKIYSPIDQGITVFADENMLKTIFRNLVSNGIKFTPEMGDITITSTLQKSQVEVTVADTGVGIPSENIAKLFRIETAVTTKGTANETGTGLGLILCKEFIEKHNGKIWVESEVGKGSKFKFTLPLP
jgi:signal transduction histidine kinase